jgi:uncharacterized damage-inducible protein DinB
MNLSEGQRLAEFSRSVRESTLKRLLQVPLGKENWSPLSGVMTFADIAHHIGEADRWLFQKLEDPTLSKMAGKAGEAPDVTPEVFQGLVAELRQFGEQRAKLLSTLTDSFLASPIFDDRFGEVTVWWVIVRGNLDHETHHRGQLAVYLRIIQDQPSH